MLAFFASKGMDVYIYIYATTVYTQSQLRYNKAQQ